MSDPITSCTRETKSPRGFTRSLLMNDPYRECTTRLPRARWSVRIYGPAKEAVFSVNSARRYSHASGEVGYRVTNFPELCLGQAFELRKRSADLSSANLNGILVDAAILALCLSTASASWSVEER